MKNQRRDSGALLYLHRGVDRTIFPRIMAATTSKDAWTTLQNEFKGFNKEITVKLQSFWKDFDTLLISKGETTQSFFSSASVIVNQIRSYGDTIEDKKIIQKVLRSLRLNMII